LRPPAAPPVAPVKENVQGRQMCLLRLRFFRLSRAAAKTTGGTARGPVIEFTAGLNFRV
jgi:hypothetical protein